MRLMLVVFFPIEFVTSIAISMTQILATITILRSIASESHGLFVASIIKLICPQAVVIVDNIFGRKGQQSFDILAHKINAYSSINHDENQLLINLSATSLLFYNRIDGEEAREVFEYYTNLFESESIKRTFIVSRRKSTPSRVC